MRACIYGTVIFEEWGGPIGPFLHVVLKPLIISRFPLFKGVWACCGTHPGNPWVSREPIFGICGV